MGSGIKTFWCEPTGEKTISFRRYSHCDSECGECSYHNAITFWKTVPDDIVLEHPNSEDKKRGDWPVKCENCDYTFKDSDEWQFFVESVYKRTDTGEKFSLRKPPIGATYDACWMPHIKGLDGICLAVVLPPNHHVWLVDGKATNCTMPDDTEHKCWVRHGDPRQANITVDKNGKSCEAGAGSIGTSKWHGFLRNGLLVE